MWTRCADPNSLFKMITIFSSTGETSITLYICIATTAHENQMVAVLNDCAEKIIHQNSSQN